MCHFRLNNRRLRKDVRRRKGANHVLHNRYTSTTRTMNTGDDGNFWVHLCPYATKKI